MTAPTRKHGGEVYSPWPAVVKPSLAGVRITGRVVAGGLTLLLGACVSPPPAVRAPDYPIAVRYAVEPVRVTHGDTLPDAIERDFSRIRALGLNTVWVTHVANDDRGVVLAAAQKDDLALLLPDRAILYYVRTGRLSRGVTGVKRLVRSRLSPSVFRSPVAGVIVGTVTDVAMYRRAADVARAVADVAPGLTVAVFVRPGYVLPPEPPDNLVAIVTADPKGGLTRSGHHTLHARAMVRVPVSPSAPNPAPMLHRWLNAYHAGLAAGATGGVVFDAYAETPGRRPGLARGDDSEPAERSAAAKQVIDRARRWGPLLRDTSPQPIVQPRVFDDSLRLVLFAKARRRFLMVWNTSAQRFVRGQVSLPETVSKTRVLRAVEVPADPGTIGGRVLEPHRGVIDVAVDLAPGDAMLYELF
jgi:hypothetical protein